MPELADSSGTEVINGKIEGEGGAVDLTSTTETSDPALIQTFTQP